MALINMFSEQSGQEVVSKSTNYISLSDTGFIIILSLIFVGVLIFLVAWLFIALMGLIEENKKYYQDKRKEIKTKTKKGYGRPYGY